MEPLKKHEKNFNHKIITAAEFCDNINLPLEAKRKVLYDEFPPNEEFMTWIKLPKEKRRIIPLYDLRL